MIKRSQFGSLALTFALALPFAACGKGGASSKITEASIAKAKGLVAAPQPLADIKPKLVELLGEPTSTNGESLVWAAVAGDECRYVELVVSSGTVNGTTGGMANAMVASEFEKCKKMAGK